MHELLMFQILGAGHYCLPERADTAFTRLSSEIEEKFISLGRPLPSSARAVDESVEEPSTPSTSGGREGRGVPHHLELGRRGRGGGVTHSQYSGPQVSGASYISILGPH